MNFTNEKIYWVLRILLSIVTGHLRWYNGFHSKLGDHCYWVCFSLGALYIWPCVKLSETQHSKYLMIAIVRYKLPALFIVIIEHHMKWITI